MSSISINNTVLGWRGSQNWLSKSHVRSGSFSTNLRNKRHVGFAPDNGHPSEPPEIDAQCQKRTYALQQIAGGLGQMLTDFLPSVRARKMV
jgi:hypothetical protein